ncbi:MAG: HupE/UreJ family protein [Alphaproteobacteria bacterium]|nr:HupE/UreJ family protein [Alphaproteobacteria bacterium]
MTRAINRLLVCLMSLCALASAAPAALAHEIRPAFLQIEETDPDTYDLMWKTPAQGDMRLALNVELPDACSNVSDPRSTLVDGAVIQRWRTKCQGGLVGKDIRIENLGASLTDVIVRYEPMEGRARTLRLNGATPHGAIPARQGWQEVAFTYFRLGVEHIAFGFDHLLFVLCLLILVGDLKRLLGAITAFTVAHSLTLAGTTFGWLKLSSAPVEASIALSIAFVAAEIVRTRRGAGSLTQRWPWLASFSFGLLHGFGFASALRQIGIPDDAAPLALLFFNLGVEAGQVMFVVLVLAAGFGGRMLMRLGAPAQAVAWPYRAAPYVAGGLAGFWFIERTARILTG